MLQHAGRTRSNYPGTLALLHDRRYQLSLFAHVSKIVWSNPQDSSVVAGTYSDPSANQGAGELRSFRMSTADKSKTQLVNMLWDQL